MSSSVHFEVRDAVGILKLHRPEVHNVVDLGLVAELERWVAELEGHDDIRAVVLTGSGTRTFCAGADLSYVSSLPRLADGLPVSLRMRDVLERLASGPRPVIAAINGDAFGGGCEILVACHLRVAAATARFGFRQAAMGVVCGWGGGSRLFRLLGRAPALRLLLTADTLDAAEALRIGLVDEVVPPPQVLATALALATRIAANSADSVRAFLELARHWEEASWEGDASPASGKLEGEIFERLWKGEHFHRKVTEWRQRRQKSRTAGG